MNLSLMIPIIVNYFNFRINQFFRLFNQESDFGTINAIGFLSIIFLNLNQFSFLFVFPIFLIHFRRKDINFLKKIFPNFWKLLILVEYSLIYLLFILSNIHYKISINSFFIYSIIILIIFIPPYPKSEYSFIKWNFIPNTIFEWKSFLREKNSFGSN